MSIQANVPFSAPKRESRSLGQVAFSLSVLLLLFVASGASCPQMIRQVSAPGPRVLPENPTLEQVVAAVNQNSSHIHSLSMNQASVSVAGYPSLKATLVAQRVRRFRLLAESFLGAEVDIGSNDELFWIWIKRNQPPAVFHCRHDQFATSSARQIMPVEPEWLFEALGAVTFDPNERHEGPVPIGQGRLQIRSTRQSSFGELVKVTVIDASTAWVLEQHLYDPRETGKGPIASSFTRAHRRDALTNLTMPRQVEIQWPTAGFTMKIDVEQLSINEIPGDPSMLWAKPEKPGYTNIDLADPSIRFALPAQPLAAQQTVPVQTPQRTGWFPFSRY